MACNVENFLFLKLLIVYFFIVLVLSLSLALSLLFRNCYCYCHYYSLFTSLLQSIHHPKDFSIKKKGAVTTNFKNSGTKSRPNYCSFAVRSLPPPPHPRCLHAACGCAQVFCLAKPNVVLTVISLYSDDNQLRN